MIIQHASSYWSDQNIILTFEYVGIETDTLKVKYGDGITRWNDLQYSGFIWINNHLEIDNSCCTKIVDTIIDDNECIMRDRIIAGNSGVIKDRINV